MKTSVKSIALSILLLVMLVAIDTFLQFKWIEAFIIGRSFPVYFGFFSFSELMWWIPSLVFYFTFGLTVIFLRKEDQTIAWPLLMGAGAVLVKFLISRVHYTAAASVFDVLIGWAWHLTPILGVVGGIRLAQAVKHGHYERVA